LPLPDVTEAMIVDHKASFQYNCASAQARMELQVTNG